MAYYEVYIQSWGWRVWARLGQLAAAGQYEQAGHADRAARLRDEAQVLTSAVWADR